MKSTVPVHLAIPLALLISTFALATPQLPKLDNIFEDPAPGLNRVDAEAAEIPQDSDKPDAPSEPKSNPKIGQLIELQKDLEKAEQLAMSEERPLLVLLGADWCTWCRKLEVDLQETDAETILKTWVVVKIDVDEQPELAESMQARGLPALRVLDFGRNVVAKHEGYLPTAELQSWLDEQYAVANPAVQAVLFGTDQPSASDLKQLIDLLADRSPKIRQAAQQRLIPHRSLSASAVVEIFKTGRLVQQLAAMQILSTWEAPIKSLDPWTPSEQTPERLSLLGEWLESIPSEEAAREVEKEAPNEVKATRLREP